jgi:hypothetical protein
LREGELRDLTQDELGALLDLTNQDPESRERT